MADINIEREDNGDAGRYVARIAGNDGEAEIIFQRRGPQVMSADHVGAADSMKGTGAALALVEYMVADARANGFKIIPVCPYVKAQYRKHPNWSDVMTGAADAAG